MARRGAPKGPTTEELLQKLEDNFKEYQEKQEALQLEVKTEHNNTIRQAKHPHLLAFRLLIAALCVYFK
jgi:hypothetical protein